MDVPIGFVSAGGVFKSQVRRDSGRGQGCKCSMDDGVGGGFGSPVPLKGKTSPDLFFRLNAELRAAITDERYGDAARLRDELVVVRSKDPLLSARDTLKNALDKEDYKTAAALRDRVRELMRQRSEGNGFSLNRISHLLVREGSVTKVVSTAADGSVPISHTKFSEKNSAYQQPSWSPSGDYLAVVKVSVVDPKQRRLLVFNVFENELVVDWNIEETPFYFFWSPCGTVLTYLSSKNGDLTCECVDVQTRERRPQFGDGRPFFYDMKQTDTIWGVAHIGSKSVVECFKLFEAPEKRERIVLTESPGSFKSPQWHPNASQEGGSQALYMVKDGTSSILKCTDIVSGESANLIRIGNGASVFSMSPDGSRLAILVRGERAEELTVIDGPFDANDQRNMEDSPFTVNLSVPFSRTLAFFWSPDSKKLLYLSEPMDSISQYHCRWNVYDFSRNVLARFEEHAPSKIFLTQIVPFFDQYSRSHRIWSADSSAFCYSAKSERLGGKRGPTFSWVQHLPTEMVGNKEDNEDAPRRIIKGPETPIPTPLLTGSELCSWSI
uniref:UVR domain-containing protein n=1 Tax=Rhodosorus marinus TaxID=101924 RepID=A0A7S2ZA59_9RHOD|mmetsp:Transcript_1063/g.2849  ORF Transcript_1063/g.2849 Transcript_1063/m.2849 type:complete len:552 (+) Transcript_1063:371-2026(+)|eukprot:CAMPEP_0113955048 /NCGR_PEP_ID=MMETSP0011_2-20120614/1035_1 /TAXON_ID=101924 /ORGANISM="Rhodosorus marinus" /LENGTH=551 /DNA_ID=CAMNT_0000964531 /DNA_START=164 /DNA_END=1819 /DNA_ORIENTATION=- /assembly_acc=CAM_ASM_000156